MLDLSAEAFGIAVRPYDDYLPLAGFADAAIPASRLHQESRGIPLEHLMLVATDDTQDIAGEPDVTALALAALGAPDREQPLFLVRGALRDSMVAALAGLVHASQWAGEDTGITHLEELGGTVVFDLLDWAVPEDSRATVLICDEPLVADARVGHAQFAAVGLRLRHGPGPLQVLDCGEGPPGAAGAGPPPPRPAGRPRPPPTGSAAAARATPGSPCTPPSPPAGSATATRYCWGSAPRCGRAGSCCASRTPPACGWPSAGRRTGEPAACHDRAARPVHALVTPAGRPDPGTAPSLMARGPGATFCGGPPDPGTAPRTWGLAGPGPRGRGQGDPGQGVRIGARGGVHARARTVGCARARTGARPRARTAGRPPFHAAGPGGAVRRWAGR
jgi:hypothetical protein